jgi:hypothetical protein
MISLCKALMRGTKTPIAALAGVDIRPRPIRVAPSP